MLRRKTLSLSNLSLFESEIIFSWKIISERKNKLLLWIYARRLSGPLWFSGRRKLPVTGLNWNSWREALPLQVFQNCPWKSWITDIKKWLWLTVFFFLRIIQFETELTNFCSKWCNCCRACEILLRKIFKNITVSVTSQNSSPYPSE